MYTLFDSQPITYLVLLSSFNSNVLSVDWQKIFWEQSLPKQNYQGNDLNQMF